MFIPGSPIGFKYHLLVKDQETIRQVNTLPFKSGQQVRLVFCSNMDGFIYVIERRPEGTQHLVFPDPRSGKEVMTTSALQDYELPAEDFFTLDKTVGKVTLDVFLSPTPLSELDPANLTGGVIPAEVWTRMETIIQGQQSKMTRMLQHIDGVSGDTKTPLMAGLVPSVFLIQYAPLFYQQIVLSLE